MELRQHESKLRKKLRQSRLLSITLLLSSLQQLADAESAICDCEACKRAQAFKREQEIVKEKDEKEVDEKEIHLHDSLSPRIDKTSGGCDVATASLSPNMEVLADPGASPIFMRWPAAEASVVKQGHRKSVRFASDSSEAKQLTDSGPSSSTVWCLNPEDRLPPQPRKMSKLFNHLKKKDSASVSVPINESHVLHLKDMPVSTV